MPNNDTNARRDEVLKRLLKTPPKPHKAAETDASAQKDSAEPKEGDKNRQENE
jgi:hypothetical protein